MQYQVWLVLWLMVAIGGWTHRHTRGSHSGDCTRAKTQRGTPTPFLYVLYDVNKRPGPVAYNTEKSRDGWDRARHDERVVSQAERREQDDR
jgi:hypothetical protein